MTAQVGETLFYKNTLYTLASEPLIQYLCTRDDVEFRCVNTSCWRGYYGTWKIIENKLYLIRLHANLVNEQQVDLNYLFSGQDVVFANWFSGKIRAPFGGMLEYEHMGYSSVFEKELHLIFENGVLVEEYEKNNVEEFIKKFEIEEQARLESQSSFQKFLRKYLKIGAKPRKPSYYINSPCDDDLPILR